MTQKVTVEVEIELPVSTTQEEVVQRVQQYFTEATSFHDDLTSCHTGFYDDLDGSEPFQYRFFFHHDEYGWPSGCNVIAAKVFQAAMVKLGYTASITEDSNAEIHCVELKKEEFIPGNPDLYCQVIETLTGKKPK